MSCATPLSPKFKDIQTTGARVGYNALGYNALGEIVLRYVPTSCYSGVLQYDRVNHDAVFS